MGMFTGPGRPQPNLTAAAPRPQTTSAPKTAPSSPAQRPTQYRGLRVLTAAARSARARTAQDKITRKTTGWQDDAWLYFDTVGELRYVCAWLTNALSRCRLVPSDVDEYGIPTGECTNPAVQQVVADIAGGPAGQSQLLGSMATHLTVPGECWVAILVTEDEQGHSQEEWHVLSTHEVQQKRGGAVEVTLPDGSTWELDPAVDSIHRVWQPHPRVASQADSAVRASLPTLREITRLSQYIEATAKNRLVSNGILAVPNEMSVPTFGDQHGADVVPDPDVPGLPPLDPLPDPGAPLPEGVRQAGPEALTDALLETFEMAVADPSSAAALAPIIIEAPGDMIGQIQHITLGTEFTDTVMKLREAAIRRLALGLNVPAEILTGLGGSNHWSAWQIEESAIKLHVEPLLTTIVDRLTEHVLRPLLAAQGMDPYAYTIWFDTSALTLRPNRSEDAQAAHAAGVIGGRTLREAMGFGDEDAPAETLTPTELRDLAVQLVKGAPSLLPMLATTIGFDLDTTATAPAEVGTPGQQPPAPPADDRTPPAREEQ